MAKKRRGKHPAVAWTALGIGAAVAVGVAAERALVKRDRRRPDPFATEEYGTLRGTSIGPVASFDGTLINVEESGSGPTVVLSHGFSLNSALWHHQVKDLSRRVRLVAYDHRGHGRSGRPPTDDYSLDALARDLDAVIRDATADEPVVLVGHSMGGMTVLRYAELFPDQIGTTVAGVVLVDSTAADVIDGFLPGIPRWLRASMQGIQESALRLLAGRAKALDRLRKGGSDLAYVGTRLMGFGRDPSPAQVDFLDSMLSAVPSEIWLKLIPSMLALDVTAALPALDVPVLIMVGSHDRLTPMAAAERMAEAIPTAELVVFQGAGHTPMLEVPNQFNARLLEFVARTVRARAT
jgi:pimeloyl-ACP methyl ester carboxylesterase